MLTLTLKLFRRACRKHPGFNPALDGRGAVKGGCVACNLLCDVYEKHQELTRMLDAADIQTARQREQAARRELAAGPDPRQGTLFIEVTA